VVVPLSNLQVRYIELALLLAVTDKYPAVDTTPACYLPRDHSEDTLNRFVALAIAIAISISNCHLPRSSNLQGNAEISLKLNFLRELANEKNSSFPDFLISGLVPMLLNKSPNIF
jgi:hypothetical protein